MPRVRIARAAERLGSLYLRGAIVPDDTKRLRNFINSMQAKGDRVIGIALDSPGGLLVEAETLAGEISQRDFGVLIPQGSECSSACFLPFAAAQRRIVGSDALVGIHSASENGEETPHSMTLTTALARDLSGYGVPDAIVGKLVRTPPGRTTWLLPSCYSPPARYSKVWTDGCLEALRRFTPTDIRRKTEPEYKEGWNSY